jgi:probable HAF family extracellular repeat protein
MKSRTLMRLTVVSLFVVLAMPAGVMAQNNQSHGNEHRHHQYKLIDIGTLGGHFVFFNFSGAPNSLLNSEGTVTASSDTTMVDPYCFGNPDCFVEHALQWRDGTLTDLGTLPGGANSNAFSINERGAIAGLAQNGGIDPLLVSSPPPWGIQVMHAAVWDEGRITDLGTLGGYLSVAQAINNRGQVVGLALNDIPDPVSAFGLYVGTQMRAFLWQGGVMQDLGTLGGPDACAALVNERGQVAGISFTNSVINPITGVPTTDPFLWENGRMLDLGTLGGTNGFANALNQRGQVVGQSNLAGDLTFHPFSWSRSGGLQDLGTFGGDTGLAYAVNDAGDVVGKADLPGSQAHHAFLWRNGVMKDLGTLGGPNICSNAHGINSSDQIIGISSDCVTSYHAALWENGGPWVDLNTLVPPHPGVQLNGLDNYINDRGEILTDGTLTNGDNHAYLLIPCDEKHPGMCDDYSMVEVADAASVAQSSVATMPRSKTSPAGTVHQLRNPLIERYRMPRD